jgi:CHAT domain-containing protein
LEYIINEQFIQAETEFKKAIDIIKVIEGMENEYYHSFLKNLGSLYVEMGNFDEAEKILLNDLDYRKKLIDDNFFKYVSALNELGILYTKLSDYSKAQFYYEEALNGIITIINSNFNWFSSSEKENYWNNNNWFFQSIVYFTLQSYKTNPSSVDLCYKANLLSKSLLLESSRELNAAILKHGSDSLKQLFDSLKIIRQRQFDLSTEGHSNNKEALRLKILADSIDKILVNNIGSFANSKKKFGLTWKDIQNTLKQSEAAIDFTVFHNYDTEQNHYGALVIRKDYKLPKFIDLGGENSIKTQLENNDYSGLYQTIWAEVEKELNNINTIYYSPDGILNQISFAALCISAEEITENKSDYKMRGKSGSSKNKHKTCGEVLIDKYSLQQLTTTRLLVEDKLEDKLPEDVQIILLGGVNYDEIPSESENNSTNDNLSAELTTPHIKKENNSKSKHKNHKEKFDFLSGTLEEVQKINILLEKDKWKVNLRSGKKVAEHYLKSEFQRNAPTILHIATHGFSSYYEKENSLEFSTTEISMKNSGLMLSGSNISWTGDSEIMIKKTGEDGILTAAEVSNLDLSKTKLVVLSACETGLGKIEGSEGTFGLKRGFKLAGVEQIIVSLWSVPDKETMELMTLFYNDLSVTLNPVISFEKAQKEMRKKYPTEPEKWAGFVLVR